MKQLSARLGIKLEKLEMKSPSISFKKGMRILGLVKKGKAPIVVAEQHYGKKSYNLHHKKPIHDGGGVYNIDNLIIVSPRMHEEIPNSKYHLGKK